MEDIFPVEIWMLIFERIDLLKLMELRLVSRFFFNLIEYFFTKSPKWKELAKSTIMYEFLNSTMQRAYPYYLGTHDSNIEDPILWRRTYLSYKKWQKILGKEHEKDFIIPMSSCGRITCISTFDTYISIGLSHGFIENYSTDDLKTPFYVVNCNIFIKQIAFWYTNDQVLVVIIGKDNALKFLDLQNKVEISTPGFFANCINYGECRHFCIGDMDGILTCYEKFENNIIAGQTINLNLREFEILLTHFFDGKTISALVYYNGKTKFCFYRITLESERVSSIVYGAGSLSITVPRDLRSTLNNIVAPSETFFLGIGKNKIGSTHYCYEKWYRIVLTKYFGCCITSIMIHAQILIFGLEDGSIHMLHINDYNQVLSLKKKKFRNAIKIEVDTVPIIKLNILEVDKKPSIVASTESRVHLINFF